MQCFRGLNLPKSPEANGNLVLQIAQYLLYFNYRALATNYAVKSGHGMVSTNHFSQRYYQGPI